MTVDFRPADLSARGEGSDHVFVVSNWVASFRTAHAAGIIPMDSWHDVMWRVCERLIENPGVETLVAEEDGSLYGFLVHEPPAPPARWRKSFGVAALDGLPYVYYAYTKEYRRRGRRTFGVGIMSGLLAAAKINPRDPLGFACKTAAAAQLMDAGRFPCARWDPLRARYEREAPR